MDGTKRIRWIFLIGILLMVIGTLRGVSHTPAKEIKPVTLSQAQKLQWVRLCIDQYPEILWLADENVKKTEEGIAQSQRSYSEQLFKTRFVEFDRTIMTLHCLRLILDGSEAAYQELTQNQPEKTKLLYKSFRNLHAQAQTLLQSKLYSSAFKLQIDDVKIPSFRRFLTR